MAHRCGRSRRLRATRRRRSISISIPRRRSTPRCCAARSPISRSHQPRSRRAPAPADRLRAASMAFFRYYADNPCDLDLGFYLFRGGMKPHGLGKERDDALNAALDAALQPIADAAEALGARREEARDPDGGHFCARGRPAAARPYRPYSHVWRLRARS